MVFTWFLSHLSGRGKHRCTGMDRRSAPCSGSIARHAGRAVDAWFTHTPHIESRAAKKTSGFSLSLKNYPAPLQKSHMENKEEKSFPWNKSIEDTVHRRRI